jgi:hypothetical protein
MHCLCIEEIEIEALAKKYFKNKSNKKVALKVLSRSAKNEIKYM